MADAPIQGYRGGVRRPEVKTGAADPVRARVARKALSAGGAGMYRQAGMMLDTIQTNHPYSSGYRLDAYRSSYANGLDQRSGTYDVPTYFVQMNDQNGGILYWPVTVQEKYQWYRYWARTDAYIGRGLELLAELPMSKLTLNMPKDVPEELREEILEKFEYQMEILDAFTLCQDILWERNMIGNCSIFHEWDAERKMWARAVMLPPEEVYIFEFPFAPGEKQVQYRPERLISLIMAGENMQDGEVYGCDNAQGALQNQILEHIPEELVKMVRESGCIIMDTDPMTGSFVHHISRGKSRYHDLGASVLERVLIPMLQKEHFRYTQLSLASRNMTPKNLVTANGLLPAELDDLRTQIDLSYLDPDYTIVTNYDVQWDQIGAQDRLLDLTTEYERIESQVFAALGVTRELLTGEGSFSGNKITVEILNTMFLNTRNVLTNYIERQLFMPIAEAHGWFEEKANGVKKYYYPKVGFNRLTIRDNAEVFDSLFQLYQKGSLDIDVIYELFNINSDEMARRLKAQLFTVKDATFNRSVEEINSEVGRAIVEKTDIVERVAKYLGLEYDENAGEEGGGFGEGGGFDDLFGQGEEGGEESTEEGGEEPTEEGGEEPTEEGGEESTEEGGEEESGGEVDDFFGEKTEEGGEESPDTDSESSSEGGEVDDFFGEKTEEGGEESGGEVDEFFSGTGESKEGDSVDELEAIVEAVTAELPPDASDEEIEEIVKQVAEAT
jgi:hypothetical protein